MILIGAEAGKVVAPGGDVADGALLRDGHTADLEGIVHSQLNIADTGARADVGGDGLAAERAGEEDVLADKAEGAGLHKV